MIAKLELGQVYFAGKGGVKVTHQDGAAFGVAEGHQVRFVVWPAEIKGELIDSRGHAVQLVADKMRRIANDKSVEFD